MGFKSFMTDNSTDEVEKKPWMKGRKFTRIKSLDELRKVVDRAIRHEHCALDLETTGLDKRRDSSGRTRAKLVGYCFAFDTDEGFYVPVRHRKRKAGGHDGSLRPENLSSRKAIREIERLVDGTTPIFHNGIFDQEFLEAESGGEITFDDPASFEDTLILSYLKNSSANRHGLKYLTKKFFGWDQPKLSDLFPGKSEKDFSLLDPSDVKTVRYAASDAICTLKVFRELRATGHSEQRDVYNLERRLVPVMRWMERVPISIDRTFLENISRGNPINWDGGQPTGELRYMYGRTLDEIVEGFEEWTDLMDKMHENPGRFEKWGCITSDQKLGALLQALKDNPACPLNVELNETEEGHVATAEEEIDRIADKCGDDLPFIAKISKFRSLDKARGYAAPLLESLDGNKKEGDEIRFKFRPYRVQTGRFSGRGGKPKYGFAQVNAQQLPGCYNAAEFPVRKINSRPEGTGDPDAEYVPELRRAIDEQDFMRKVYDGHFLMDNSTEEEFCVRKSCSGCPFVAECDHEDPEPKRWLSVDASIRRAVKAREDRVIVAIDYSGVELRTAANLSGEQKWIDEFYRCGSCGQEYPELKKKGDKPPKYCTSCGEDSIGDLHTLTAKIIWGDDVVNKSDFKLYRQQAKGTNFATLYGGGAKRIGEVMGKGPREGARIKKRLMGGLSDLNAWMKRKVREAERNGETETHMGRKIRFHHGGEYRAVNSIVQGTATGDLTRLAMWLVWRELKKRGDLEDCFMFGSLHDELVFEIKKDRLDDLIPLIRKCMTAPATELWGFKVPLQVDVEVGETWDCWCNWDKIHYVEDGGQAKAPVPGFLKGHIAMKPGMYYEGESPVEREEIQVDVGEQGGSEDDGDVTSPTPENSSPPPEDNPDEGTVGGDVDGDEAEASDGGGEDLPEAEPSTDPTADTSDDDPAADDPEESGPREFTASTYFDDDDDDGDEDTGPAPEPLPDLPVYEYQTDWIVNENTTQQFMLQLMRVTDYFDVSYGGGDHLLKVVDQNGNAILKPEWRVVRVAPEYFAILADYEGI